MKRVQAFPHYFGFVVIFAIYASMLPTKTEAQGTPQETENRTDVMGRYTLRNSLMCQRMCWYRKLCVAYSVSNTPESDSENCLLHADPLEVNATLSANWTTTVMPSANTTTSILNGCANRTCNETDGLAHACLPLPANCRPPHVKNGTVDWTGPGLQNDVANVTCDVGFTLAPANISGQLTCHVTGRWIPGNVTCQANETNETNEVTTQAPAVCQNGGTYNGSHCKCTIQYGGRTCQRYIIDCSEAAANGFVTHGLNGLYWIQPREVQHPFQVLCELQAGGSTIPFWREVPSSVTYNLPWEELKWGFPYRAYDHFVGLENLHRLTTQTPYNLRIHLQGDWDYLNYLDVNYINFRIKEDASFYSLTFNSAEPAEGNGFGDRFPILFSAADTNVNPFCYNMRGVAGWYNAGSNTCGGFSTFQNGFIEWPAMFSPAKNWTSMKWFLTRM